MLKNKFTVIVADDEKLIAKNIAKNITKVNDSFEVTHICHNGEEVLDTLKQTIPHVLFTDIKMPIMDGLELAKIVNEKYTIKTVIVSGFNDFAYAKEALSYGVSSYLLKPINIDELTNVLNTLESQLNAENSVLSVYTESKAENIVENLKIYIKHNYNKNISMQGIAEQYGFSQAYLSKIFKKTEGTTPLKYLNDYRINTAKTLLLTTELQVKQVGEMVGFSDQFHFSKLFKDIAGISPQAFRDENE